MKLSFGLLPERNIPPRVLYTLEKTILWLLLFLLAGHSCDRRHHRIQKARKIKLEQPETITMPRRMTAYFRAKLKGMAEMGDPPNAIQVWAYEMGCLMTMSTLRYHISGYNHPRHVQIIHADKRLITLIDELMLEDDNRTFLQVQDLLLSRHSIKAGLATVRYAGLSLGWQGGERRSSSFTFERMLYTRHVNETKTFDDLLFTNEITVSLEHSNRLSIREKGLYSTTRVPDSVVTLHVWAGISTKGPGPFCIYEGLVSSTSVNDLVVNDTLVPWLKTACPQDSRELFVVIDHDPRHLQKAASMDSVGLRWIRAPPEPFHVNPVKMIWSQLTGWLRHVHKPVSKAHLSEGIKRFWFDVLTQHDCVMTIGSLQKVLPAVEEQDADTTCEASV